MENKKSLRNLILVIAIPVMLLILLAALFGGMETPPKTYTFSDVIGFFADQKVTEYSLDFGTGEMSIKVNGTDSPVSFMAPDSQYMQERLDPYVEQYNKKHPTARMVQKLQRPKENNWLLSFLPFAIAVAIMLLFTYLMMRKVNTGLGDAGKQMNFGKAKVKKPAQMRKRQSCRKLWSS